MQRILEMANSEEYCKERGLINKEGKEPLLSELNDPVDEATQGELENGGNQNQAQASSERVTSCIEGWP